MIQPSLIRPLSILARPAAAGSAVSPGLQAAVLFGGSLPGHILMSLGQALVVVCLCFDFVRAVSVPRSHRRYVANTVFRTLALPSILVMAFSVLIDAASGSWPDVARRGFRPGRRDLPVAP